MLILLQHSDLDDWKVSKKSSHHTSFRQYLLFLTASAANAVQGLTKSSWKKKKNFSFSQILTIFTYLKFWTISDMFIWLETHKKRKGKGKKKERKRRGKGEGKEKEKKKREVKKGKEKGERKERKGEGKGKENVRRRKWRKEIKGKRKEKEEKGNRKEKERKRKERMEIIAL